jgi:hypothetical protein
MPDPTPMVRLYNPTLQAWHDVPDHPVVVQDFQDKGWETPAESAARAEAEAAELHGKALNKALDQAGLSKSGTVAEKQARLAEYEAAQTAELIDGDTTTESEGEQV